MFFLSISTSLCNDEQHSGSPSLAHELQREAWSDGNPCGTEIKRKVLSIKMKQIHVMCGHWPHYQMAQPEHLTCLMSTLFRLPRTLQRGADVKMEIHDERLPVSLW